MCGGLRTGMHSPRTRCRNGHVDLWVCEFLSLNDVEPIINFEGTRKRNDRNEAQVRVQGTGYGKNLKMYMIKFNGYFGKIQCFGMIKGLLGMLTRHWLEQSMTFYEPCEL